MALRNLRTVGDIILKKTSKPVKDFDEKMHQLVDDMLETMYDAGGVGLAAVQIGILKRILVMDLSEEQDQPVVMINPVVIHNDGEQEGREGCLSIPGKNGLVKRPLVTLVKAQDRNGTEFELRMEERLAVAFNHELDHLNGVLYTEKATDMQDNEEEDDE